MADITTEQKILDYLKQCQGERATVPELCDAICVHKRSLRTHLRQLKRNKLVSENRKTTPPTWSLSHQGKQSSIPPPPDPQNLRERIVKYLSQQNMPKPAIEVAKSLGLHTKKSVNHILYRLQKEQILVSVTPEDKKPLWRLSEKATTMDNKQLFKDTSRDSSAPGAYSPEKSSKGAGLHSERTQHRHVQRSHSNPYSTATHSHRSRNQSGSGQSLSSHTPTSQDPIKPSGSSTLADSGSGSTSSESCRQERLLTVLADGKDRETTVASTDHTKTAHTHTDLKHSEATCSDSTQNVSSESEPTVSDLTEQDTNTSTEQSSGADMKDSDGGDESMDVDEDYEEDSEPRDLTERYQDMMGDLMFADMTYVEELDVPEEDSMISSDIIVLQLSFMNNQTASALQLAQALEKTEEEIYLLLKSCGDKVEVSNNLWTLTEQGAAWANQKSEAFPFLTNHFCPSIYEEDTSSHQAQLGHPSSSSKGPPLFPQQLIATDPSFSVKSYSGRGTEGSVSSKSPVKCVVGIGKGRGRDPGTSGSAVSTGSRDGHSRDGEFDSPPGQPEFSFVPPPPPSAYSIPSILPTAVATPANRTTSGFVQQTHPAEQRFRTPPVMSDTGQRSQPGAEQFYSRSRNQPVMGINPEHSATSSLQTAYGPQSMVVPQEQGQFVSLPSSSSFPSMYPALLQFADEGLKIMPASGARMMPDHPVTTELISVPMAQSGVPSVDVLERQLGNAGTAAQPVGEKPDNSSSLEPSSSSSSSMHRSHSQPQLNTDSGVVAGGEGLSSMLKITSESFAALNKNPISALMEYAQSRRLQAVIEVVSQKGPSHRPVFLMAAKVGSRQFAGVTCHNKKDGRKEAADVALRTLIAEGQYSAIAPTPSINLPAEQMTHFDKIAALTHQTFNTLIATIPENLAGRKVIAGLVMKRSEDDVGLVISIGTGNRCITGDKLSLEGNTVNDSHAEIITRRGFMRFLYQQLEKYEHGQPHDLFESGKNGRLRVKDGITFHLYISTAPCGDGALFSPRDVESNSGVMTEIEKREHHPTFTSNVQGLLRTKMEGGEGTIPVDTKDITMQTWDGVVRGERLRTMSCTDKICRWNVLGLQGALLSHFVEPVYLDSLTLGFLYDHGHLSRAVCCRLARDEPHLNSRLPPDFRLNHPWLGRVTACQPLRETQKTKAFSINWTIGDQKAEVLDGTLGHCYTAVEKRLFSRLAKRCLYDSFKAVAQHLGRSDLLEAPTYHHNKQAARPFQEAKSAMISKFQQMGCGWVKKPVEEEMFS